MNSIGEDYENLTHKYNHNLIYSDVMKELDDISNLEIIRYPNCNDYYNTETLHFDTKHNKISVKIHQWTLQHDPTINPVNCKKILDSKQQLIDDGCPHNISTIFKYRDDKRHHHF